MLLLFSYFFTSISRSYAKTPISYFNEEGKEKYYVKFLLLKEKLKILVGPQILMSKKYRLRLLGNLMEDFVMKQLLFAVFRVKRNKLTTLVSYSHLILTN